jgi:hypothetical protein
VCIARRRLAGRTRQQHHQRLGAVGQVGQRRAHVLRIGRPADTGGIGFELRQGLRPAQHQGGQQRQRRRLEQQLVLETVAPLRHASCKIVARREAQRLQAVERGADFALGQVHHRMARGLLVGRRHQRVHGHRVVLRRGDGLFHQRGQHADFSGCEQEFGHSIGRRVVCRTWVL